MKNEKRDRLYKVNAVDIPIARLMGFVLLTVMLVLHNYFVFNVISWTWVFLYAFVTISYAFMAWVMLRLHYQKQTSFDMGLFFLCIDLFFYSWLVYLSGGNESWLVFILAVRTADQILTKFNRVLLFSILTIASYICLLLFLHFVDHKQINVSVETAKILVLAVFNVYMLMMVPIAEQLHRRALKSVRLAKDEIQNRQKVEEELKELNKTLKEINDELIVENVRRKKEEEQKEQKIKQLQDAIAEIRTLKGLIPICASCKKIRDDKGYWNQIESYIQKHSEAEFSHGVCPECSEKLYGNEKWYLKMKAQQRNE